MIDMAGKKYGRLLAISPTGILSPARNMIWNFICDCGNDRVVDGYIARSGKTKECLSCSKHNQIEGLKTHGKSYTTEFSIWTGMLTRCFNKNCKAYINYGGRGITVCDSWKNSFEEFNADMGDRPSKGSSIERIDTNGNYEPSNCKWATKLEQIRNRRTTVSADINGKTRSIAEWCELTNLPYTMVYSRYKNGIHGEELLYPGKNKGTVSFNGITDTFAGWSKRTGLKPSTIAMRISQYGWSIEDALTKGVQF